MSIVRSFEKVIDETYTCYRGVLIEKCADGFIVFGQKQSSIEAARSVIDKSYKVLENSIKK